MGSSENLQVRVVSDSEEEVWKDIPGFTFQRYSASSLGNIRREVGPGIFHKVRIYDRPTSVGKYLCTVCIDDSGIQRSKGVHVFVCMAFHGLPPNDGLVYEVNHEDGNKENNRASNVEWMTRKDNTIHALKTGLRNDNLEVVVTDLKDGSTVIYYSISELSRVFKLPRNDVKRLIVKHSEIPYQDRWLFELRKERLGKIVRGHHDAIKAMDYVGKRIIVTANATDMYYQTGVHSATILSNLKLAEGEKNTLIGGYGFKLLTDNTPFAEYSDEEIATSREKYTKRLTRSKKASHLVKNYETGVVTEYVDIKTACEKEGVNYGTVRDILLKPQLVLHKGRVFQRKEDFQNWPDFNSIAIAQSIHAKKLGGKSLEVTDLETNTTKLYHAISEFAREIGKDPDKFGAYVKRYEGKVFLDRYLMKLVAN